jgi:hypothetical protein
MTTRRSPAVLRILLASASPSWLNRSFDGISRARQSAMGKPGARFWSRQVWRPPTATTAARAISVWAGPVRLLATTATSPSGRRCTERASVCRRISDAGWQAKISVIAWPMRPM